MPKVKISEYSTTNADNTDIEGINIAEGCAPSGINNAIRELMVHLKEFQTGASGDGFTFAGGTLMTGTNTLSGTNVLSGSTTAAFAAGTVSAPSIAAHGDTNTGIFFPAADTIAFAEGGAEAMRIDSSGNVGIGTSSPSLPLDIVSNSSSETVKFRGGSTNVATLRFNSNDGATNYSAIQSRSTFLDIGTSTAIPLTFSTNSAERMRIDSSGNVGIGATPSAWSTVPAIQVSTYGGLSAGGGYTRLSSNAYLSTWPTTWSYINTSTASLYEQASGNHIWSTAASGTAGNAITFTERMRIDSSGNVQLSGNLGLGGTTPTTSGTGITFPATQSASSNANTLDDYEEGTWTGTLKGITTDPTTPVTATGKYTKIGRQVTVSIYFNNVTTTGASGLAYISGLPFTEDGNRAVGTLAVFNFDLNTGTSAYCDVSSTNLFFGASKDDASWQDILHNPGAGRYVRATVTYFV